MKLQCRFLAQCVDIAPKQHGRAGGATGLRRTQIICRIAPRDQLIIVCPNDFLVEQWKRDGLSLLPGGRIEACLIGDPSIVRDGAVGMVQELRYIFGLGSSLMLSGQSLESL